MVDKVGQMKENHLIVAVLIFIAAGCAGGQRPQATESYLLDYQAPALEATVRLDSFLKVERFAINQLYNSNTMTYRTGPFSLNTFPYERWRANPADLVTDCLVRDFRSAGIFRAVFSYRDPEQVRFGLEGQVLEFTEIEEGGNRKAALALSVTLLDLSRKEILQRVVFQKKYAYASQYREQGPQGLARGLSESLAQLSRQIIGDVYQTLRDIDREGRR